MRVDVLGVGFDNLTMAEAVEQGMKLIAEEGCHYVVTPNPEIVEVCRENPTANEAVNGADLVLPDGVGVVKGARILGTPLKEKTPGIEFAAHLMERMAAEGKSLYLLGAKPGIAELAAGKLKETYPGLVIAGYPRRLFQGGRTCGGGDRQQRCGRGLCVPGRSQAGALDEAVRAVHRRHLLCGLGGSLDVFAGVVQRAPAVWSRMGLSGFTGCSRSRAALGA